MAKKFEIRFDDAGKIVIKDIELMRRIQWLLEHDRRLTVVFDPHDPTAIVTQPARPSIPPVPVPILKDCPGPADVMCPMYLKDVRVDIENKWARDDAWNKLGLDGGVG